MANDLVARINRAMHHFLSKGEEADGWSCVRLSRDRYAFVNADGRYLNGGEMFKHAESFCDGTAVVTLLDGRDDIIGKDGKSVLPGGLMADDVKGVRILSFGNGPGRENVKRLRITYASRQEKEYVIRRDGRPVWDDPVGKLTVCITKDFLVASKKSSISRYYYKYKVLTPFFAKIKDVREGVCKVGEDDKWGVFDVVANRLAIPIIYNDIDSYGEDFIVTDDDGSRVVDISNKTVDDMNNEKGMTPVVFDKDQEKVIEAEGGRFLVLAPPGCGKTEILSERIIRARAKGVRFEDMACLTFTNRASSEMLKRVKEKVKEEADRVFVGNIHKYCNSFLLENQLISGGARIMAEDEMRAVIMENCDIMPALERRSRGKEVPEYLIKEAVRKIEGINNYISQKELGEPEELLIHKDTRNDSYEPYYEMISLHKRISFGDPSGYISQEEEEMLCTAKNVAVYRKFKKDHDLMTFTDLLIKAYEHLRHDKERKYRRYKWIEVDEVQDLNALEITIIDELTDTEGDYTVIYLGDEQQAIFSFAGAKTHVLEMLHRRCEGHTMTLGINHRSPKYLLDTFNRYAAVNLHISESVLPQSDRIVDHEPEDLRILNCGDYYGEPVFVADLVKEYHDLYPTQRTAVIVHSNASADKISERLSDLDINHYKISGKEVTSTKGYKATFSLLCACVNEDDNIAWARLIYGISDYSLTDAIVFTSKMKALMMTPADLTEEETYAAAFLKSYDKEEMVFFDTETTGLSVLEDDIVQIAAFKVRGGKKVEGSDFSILMETDRELPEKLGDIDNPLVKVYAENKHVPREEGLGMFLDYIGDDSILGHNVNFDYYILKYNVERTLGRDVDHLRKWDSLKLIRLVEPQLRSHKLKDLLALLSLQGTNSHLADDDVEATKSVVDYCVEKIRPVIERQCEFLSSDRAQAIAEKLNAVKPLMCDIRSRLYRRYVSESSLADEMRKVYSWLTDNNIVKADKKEEMTSEKIGLIIRYVKKEWTDDNGTHTLIDALGGRIRFLNTLREADLVNSPRLISSRVFVMTVHKAKGLEFENVIITDVYNGIYPFFSNEDIKDADEKEGKDMEDARLLYVGLSRARNRLCVAYPDHISRYPKTLSPFMSCIADEFVSNDDDGGSFP